MIGNIYITGEIGVDITLIDVVGQVKSKPEATEYKVHINSPGGYVDTGFDIYHYLKSLQKPVTTYGNGMVASIATVIFMAGYKREVAANTEFMIHNPWTEGIGNADELESQAKQLRQVEKQLLDFYKKELALEDEALQPLLRDETWLTSDQLLTLGFTTAQPIQVVAKAYLNNNPNKQSMTENEKQDFLTRIEGMFSGALAKLGISKSKKKVMAKLVQDGTGAELDFPDLADGDPIEVGATATVDGVPAEGEYTMPDGSVYVFAAGVLQEIRPADNGDQMAAAQAEIESLKEQLAAATAKATENENALAQLREDAEKQITEIKAMVKSGLQIDDKKDPKPQAKSKDRAEGLRDYLSKKK